MELEDIIRRSKRIVFFGGAGVSTASGIPDFRSTDGLYNAGTGADGGRPGPSPEDILSATYFALHTKEFYDFYRAHMVYPDAQPNACHRYLYELEKQDKLRAIVTQNIDGLHQAAGSRTVFELHGSVMRNFCMRCRVPYSLDEMLSAREESGDGIPSCSVCGSIIKPDVVLYEEGLDMNVLSGAIDAIERASLLVIAGTSLVVNPAASLIHYFHGDHLAIVNLSPTSADRLADLVIAEPVGKVFDF